jgi:membrane protease YdiL (CAAX protease family)
MTTIESTMPVPKTTSLSPWMAWRNALGISLLGCLIVGLGNFVLAAGYFARATSLIKGALWLSVSFTISFAIILLVIIRWQSRHGESLAELGWRKPTRAIAVIMSIALSLVWVAFSYSGASYLLPKVNLLELPWIRLIMAVLGIFISTTEVIMMRGFFMTQLQRGGIPTWIQMIASGTCSALYHSLHSISLMSFLPSFILFTSMAGIFVLGKRSITATAIGHSLIHILGDPYLTMLILVTTL